MLLNQTDEFHARLCLKTAEQKLGNNRLKILKAAMPNSSTAQALKLVQIFWGIAFVCFYLFRFSIWGSYPCYLLHFGATSLHFGAQISHLSQIWESKIANLDGICNIFGVHPCSHRFQRCLDCFYPFLDGLRLKF